MSQKQTSAMSPYTDRMPNRATPEDALPRTAQSAGWCLAADTVEAVDRPAAARSGQIVSRRNLVVVFTLARRWRLPVRPTGRESSVLTAAE